jgi:hypothetical protein
VIRAKFVEPDDSEHNDSEHDAGKRDDDAEDHEIMMDVTDDGSEATTLRLPTRSQRTMRTRRTFWSCVSSMASRQLHIDFDEKFGMLPLGTQLRNIQSAGAVENQAHQDKRRSSRPRPRCCPMSLPSEVLTARRASLTFRPVSMTARRTECHISSWFPSKEKQDSN